MNTIVFSSKVGLEMNGAANVVTGTHAWFPINRALAFIAQGVMAFSINQGQNRFTGNYIDGSRAVFSGAGLNTTPRVDYWRVDYWRVDNAVGSVPGPFGTVGLRVE